ncbi:putative GABA transporter 2 [Curcuma longa]|uniref:putative GABA transporter 2 n=1 Tax=Curcuma longa TaxID=136217 RepID=UPI003D9EA462
MGADGSPYAHSFAANGSALEAAGGGAPADAGAAFVLESKGTWWHAGFHLTTAIVGPTILTLPYAFRGLGWGLGLASLTAVGAVTFYAYVLMSRVLDHCEKQGRRHIRFRELAADVLGFGWIFYLVVFFQAAINTGISIGCILLSGECLKIMYSSLSPNGPLRLYHFIIMATVVLILLSQLPSFHSLRHFNLASLFLSLAYSALVTGGCIYAGYSKNAPTKDYSLDLSSIQRTYNAFTSISILASLYGNGILPEIQATLAPPATGKMVKGLALCYMVAVLTFYSAAVSGYWAFGNKVSSNVLNSLLPDSGPSLAPIWLLGLGVVFVLLQLFAIGLVYSQVAFEIMEKNSADTRQSRFSKRNLVPRLILRTLYMVFCAFMAAMLPFFGDIVAVVGAIGFIPLDFILPMLLYNITIGTSKRSAIHWFNIFIMIIFTGVGIMGAFASIRKMILDADQFKLFSDNVVN